MTNIKGFVSKDISIKINITINLNISIFINNIASIFILTFTCNIQFIISINIVTNIKYLIFKVVFHKINFSSKSNIHSTIENGCSIISLLWIAAVTWLSKSNSINFGTRPTVVICGAIMIFIALWMCFTSIFIINNWLNIFWALIVFFSLSNYIKILTSLTITPVWTILIQFTIFMLIADSLWLFIWGFTVVVLFCMTDNCNILTSLTISPFRTILFI